MELAGRNDGAMAIGVVYPGIDLVYYGNQRRLEYDFLAAAGADVRRIRLKISGEGPNASGARIDHNGDLIVDMGNGEARVEKPVAYPPAPGGDTMRSTCDSRFRPTAWLASTSVATTPAGRSSSIRSSRIPRSLPATTSTTSNLVLGAGLTNEVRNLVDNVARR